MFSANTTIIVFIHVNKPQLNPNLIFNTIQSDFQVFTHSCCWKTKPISTITFNPNMCHPKPTLLSPQPDMVEPFMIFKFYTRSPNYKLWAMYSVGGVYVYGWACQVEKCNFRMVSHNKLNPILLNRKWMFETIRGPVCGRHCTSPFVEIPGISQQQQSNQEHRWEWFIVKSNITSNKLQNLKLFPEGVPTDQTTPRSTFPV